MKKLSLLFSACLGLTFAGMAQTAVNFTCNDCAGNNHDLFTELDAGKVIVICWVMPCGACIGPSLTTYSVVQEFQTTHPNTVFMYLCDDFANTSCSSINSWGNSNGLTGTTRFSDPSIKMTDYGSTGMPKVVVIGGSEHAVFYNANNSVNAASLRDAIEAAVSAATGIAEDSGFIRDAGVFPNPSGDLSRLAFTLERPSEIKMQVHDLQGRLMTETDHGILKKGRYSLEVSTSALQDGIYHLSVSDGRTARRFKIAVSH